MSFMGLIFTWLIFTILQKGRRASALSPSDVSFKEDDQDGGISSTSPPESSSCCCCWWCCCWCGRSCFCRYYFCRCCFCLCCFQTAFPAAATVFPDAFAAAFPAAVSDVSATAPVLSLLPLLWYILLERRDYRLLTPPRDLLPTPRPLGAFSTSLPPLLSLLFLLLDEAEVPCSYRGMP